MSTDTTSPPALLREAAHYLSVSSSSPLVMASAVAAAPTTPETLITIKVFYEGCNRKFKLPLKDLAVAIFPTKVYSPHLSLTEVVHHPCRD